MNDKMPTLHFKTTAHDFEKKEKRENLDDSKKKLTFRPKRRLKLQLTKKCKNSPFLSIQKFLKEEINDYKDLAITRDLWDKYRKQPKYSLLIDRHRIDFHIFLELYYQIMNTQKHLEEPAYIPRKFIRPSNSEMEYLVL